MKTNSRDFAQWCGRKIWTNKNNCDLVKDLSFSHVPASQPAAVGSGV